MPDIILPSYFKLEFPELMDTLVSCKKGSVYREENGLTKMTQRKSEYGKNFGDFEAPEIYSDEEVVGSGEESPNRLAQYRNMGGEGDGGESMESEDD